VTKPAVMATRATPMLPDLANPPLPEIVIRPEFTDSPLDNL